MLSAALLAGAALPAVGLMTGSASADVTTTTALSSSAGPVIVRAPTYLRPFSTFNWLRETFTVEAGLYSRGTPLAGQPLTFTVGWTRLCTPTTDSHGWASCVLSPSQSLLLWQTRGQFTVSFAGSPSYYPSRATNGRHH
jgi:hypothetical protein